MWLGHSLVSIIIGTVTTYTHTCTYTHALWTLNLAQAHTCAYTCTHTHIYLEHWTLYTPHMSHTHTHSSSLWDVPQIIGGGSVSLPGTRAPPHTHAGKMEDTDVGVSTIFCTTWCRNVGVVSTRSHVSAKQRAACLSECILAHCVKAN